MANEAPPEYLDSNEAASARMAARLAAEARMLEQQSSSSSSPNRARTVSDAHRDAAPESFTASDKLPFYRIVNNEILPKLSKSQAVKTVDMLLTIVSNILDPPNPQKATMYRQLRLSNKQVASNIADVPGALDFLYEAKFRKETREFEAYLAFASAPSPQALHRLRVARFVLRDVLSRAKAEEEREQRYKQAEKDAEAQRGQRALLQFEEDRRLKRERDERARIVRDAKAQREEAGPAPAVRPRPTTSTSAPRPRRGPPVLPPSRRSGPTNNSDGPPPAYGALHGRVLGTGLPPDPVLSNISQQDLEPSDEDDDDERDDHDADFRMLPVDDGHPNDDDDDQHDAS